MRNVNNGWIVRYTHANVASFFFICVYAHVARGIYYGSFKSPRVLVWSIGVIILILMMAIAFLGYVLPYGQMSYWGDLTATFLIFLFYFKYTYYLLFNINNIFIYYINLIIILILLKISTYFFKYTNKFKLLQYKFFLILIWQPLIFLIKSIKLLSKFIFSVYYSTSSLNGINSPIKPDFIFMCTFMGFIDGDGYIDVGEQKQYKKKTKELSNSTIRIAMGLGLDARDLYMLNLFANVLGVGKVRPIPNTNKYRLLFSKSDLVNVIIPLIKKYNITFLVYNRVMQYNLMKYIIDNNIIHWSKLQTILENRNKLIPFVSYTYLDIVKLPQFCHWLIGFTMAEGSFFIKIDNSCCYNIRQTGIINLPLMNAIQFILLGKIKFILKPDSSDSYQLSLSSINDIQQVVNFFSFYIWGKSNPLKGYKGIQYVKWINIIKVTKRYKNVNLPDLD